jgi:hypothetical protein
MQINLNISFGFFSNGMGSYVAIDVTNCEKNNATFWSGKIQPKYNINGVMLTNGLLLGFRHRTVLMRKLLDS